MSLPNPVIGNAPLHVWLGILALIFIIMQILVGKRILRLPFWVHTRVIWVVLLSLAVIHGLYGFSIYFLR